MSGGSFDYAYLKTKTFADELEAKLHMTEYEFSDEVRAKLNLILDQTKKTAFMMREVEWLFSGDTGEDSFLERIAEYKRKA